MERSSWCIRTTSTCSAHDEKERTNQQDHEQDGCNRAEATSPRPLLGTGGASLLSTPGALLRLFRKQPIKVCHNTPPYLLHLILLQSQDREKCDRKRANSFS